MLLLLQVLLHHQYWTLRKQYCEEDHVVSFTVPVTDPVPPQYFVRLVSDRWLQCEAVLPVSFRHLLLPEKFPPPTELLDLQPLPVSALRNPAFESLYTSQGLATFNPIQTQAFNALYNTDDNVLLAAPTGSGKTICAEFAILRALQQAADGKAPPRIVYVAPVEAVAKEKLAAWGAKFGAGLGLAVAMLTGEAAVDVKTLDKSNIVIATPEHWDMLSRRWKQRKSVQQLALFVVDELHLIGGPKGPTLEVAVSRMRYISAQLARPIRIVGLAHSLANARDLGDWMGASSHGLFNFPPGVRPVPLEIHIQAFDILNFDARMQAMSRPAYAAINAHAGPTAPVLVYVPTRKHAKLMALDLLTYAASDGEPGRFCLAAEADLAPYLAKIRDPALKHSLAYGVAYMHEAMPERERAVVGALFESGAIRCVVATATLCWANTLAAALVVVMGTQYYDPTGLAFYRF